MLLQNAAITCMKGLTSSLKGLTCKTWPFLSQELTALSLIRACIQDPIPLSKKVCMEDLISLLAITYMQDLTTLQKSFYARSGSFNHKGLHIRSDPVAQRSDPFAYNSQPIPSLKKVGMQDQIPLLAIVSM